MDTDKNPLCPLCLCVSPDKPPHILRALRLCVKPLLPERLRTAKQPLCPLCLCVMPKKPRPAVPPVKPTKPHHPRALRIHPFYPIHLRFLSMRFHQCSS